MLFLSRIVLTICIALSACYGQGAPAIRTTVISSGFSPRSISDLRLWLRADLLGFADSTPVSTWADQSVNGKDAIQATASKKPLLRTNILNGLPILRFDGVDDTLSSVITSPQPLTVCFLGSITNTDNAMTSDPGSGSIQIWRRSTGTVWAMNGGITLTGSAQDANVHVITAIFNGANSSFYVDGVNKMSGNAGATGLTTGLSIGFDTASYASGDIAEFTVYAKSLETNERQKLERFLGSKYGIVVQ